jgi:hypothetical protein
MLFGLLSAPFTAPVSGLRFVLEQIGQMAEREFFDEQHIREELLLLQLRLDEGDISEEEYAREEGEIVARLRRAREYRQAASREPET